MSYKVERTSSGKVIFEANISVEGHGFHLIYGEADNGYWCCITNWDVGGKMASPDNFHYNRAQLEIYGIAPHEAVALAHAIADLAKGYQSETDKWLTRMMADCTGTSMPDMEDELDGPC